MGAYALDDKYLDKAELRKFGLITGVLFVILFAFFFPWFLEMDSTPNWPWVIAALLWLPALIMPASLRPVYIIWMRIAHVIGSFNTRIILSLVYYVMIMPMGIVMRVFGKDSMARKFDAGRASYRIKSVRESKERLEKPY